MRNSLTIKVWRGVAALSCLLLVSTTGCASYSRTRTEKRVKENAAVTAAQQWLEMLDAGDYEKAFERKALRYRTTGTAPQFARYMHAYRAPFGRALSRKFIGAHTSKKLVGLPDGEYETVLFKTGFEKKAAAGERVILTKESGQRRVIGYRVY